MKESVCTRSIPNMKRGEEEEEEEKNTESFLYSFSSSFLLNNCYILIVNNPVTVGSLFESISWPT